jgi:hypothetical protein
MRGSSRCAATFAAGCLWLSLPAACELAYPTKLATTDAGSDAPIVPGDGAGSCDPAQPPSASPCVIDEAYGVFVASSGSDASGSGSRASPFATIGRGITAAGASSLRVYVCSGTGVRYDEHVQLADGISVYGGLACPTGTAADWTYTGSPAEVTPSTAGYALYADALLSATAVTDLAFTAGPLITNGDAGSPGLAGASSIAAFLVSSSSLLMTRVSLISGDGLTGSPGSTSSNYDGPTATAGNSAETASQVAGAVMCSCLDGTTSTGGGGGQNSSYNGAAGTSMPAVAAPVANGGVGGTDGCQGAPSTSPGANGASGVGAAASTSPGTLASTGWIPAPPVAAATSGAPGQGGGGAGFDLTCAPAGGGPAGGGGGGCGGCGGRAATGGTAGGSSFALLVYDSTVVLDTCALTAGSGGAAGAGGDGQPGQQGGGIGAGYCCAGTMGGNGGAGGGGAGGAGGLAYGVGFSGLAPSTSKTTIAHGAGGKGGAGGSASAGAPGAGGVGLEGTSGAVMAF